MRPNLLVTISNGSFLYIIGKSLIILDDMLNKNSCYECCNIYCYKTTKPSPGIDIHIRNRKECAGLKVRLRYTIIPGKKTAKVSVVDTTTPEKVFPDILIDRDADKNIATQCYNYILELLQPVKIKGENIRTATEIFTELKKFQELKPNNISSFHDNYDHPTRIFKQTSIEDVPLFESNENDYVAYLYGVIESGKHALHANFKLTKDQILNDPEVIKALTKLFEITTGESSKTSEEIMKLYKSYSEKRIEFIDTDTEEINSE